jgi:cell division protein FtsI (penicillin-binding protein 3)
VVYVMIDEPRKSIYGGVVAAPAFKRINQRLACYYNYPPATGTTRLAMGLLPEEKEDGQSATAQESETGAKAARGCAERKTGPRLMPDLTGRTIREALTLVSRYRGRVEISGQGRIAAQQPEPGTELKPGLDFSFRLQRDI